MIFQFSSIKASHDMKGLMFNFELKKEEIQAEIKKFSDVTVPCDKNLKKF